MDKKVNANMGSTWFWDTIPEASDEVIKNYDDFFKLCNKTEDEILAQIWSQSQEGINFVTRIREQLQADFILFKDQKSNEDKIWDTTIFNNHTSLMSRSFLDRPTALFDTYDSSKKDAVINLNAAYKEDYEEEDYEILEYMKDFYKFLFWVSIKARIWWNWYTKAPKFQVVDPRIWVCDPNGNYFQWEYAYTWFEKLFDRESAANQGWMNMDTIYPLNNSAYSLVLLKKRDQNSSSLINIGTNRVFNPYFDIYYHFGDVECADGKFRKFVAVLWNNRRLLLSIKFQPATCKEEEENPELITHPLAFYYWKPEPNNPFGDRPANKLRDVQRVKAIIANLRLNKAKAELYPMYFYNKKYIQNKSDLWFGFNKFIGIDTMQDWAVDLDSIVKSFKPDTKVDTSLVIDQSLDKQTERSTSIWDSTFWVTPENRESATMTNNNQSNTDINLSINSKIDNWWQKQFLREWLRWYLENFTTWDKKFVSVDTWVGTVPAELTKKEFLIGIKVKIKILSKWEIEQQKNKDKLWIQILYSATAADPNVPTFSKTLLLRDYAEAMDFPVEKIATRFWVNPEEEIAKQENWLLLQWIPVKVNPNDDDFIHLIMQKDAWNSEAAELHYLAHIKQWKSKGKPQPQTWWGNAGMLESMNAQVAANASWTQARSIAQSWPTTK